MPAATTVPALLLSAAERFGRESAIEQDGQVWTFEDLASHSLRAARSFVALGVEPGERVAIWAPNCREWIAAAIGLQCAGAVLVPLNTRYKGREAAHILRKSRARVLCAASGFLGIDYLGSLDDEDLPDLAHRVLFRAADGGGPSWEAFLALGDDVAETVVLDRISRLPSEAPSDILFTSGTTGEPKGVVTSHGQTLRVFEVWSDLVGLRREDRYLLQSNFFHTMGYKAGWLACLIRGTTMLPQMVFDVPAILDRVVADRVSVLIGPPTIYQSILSHPDRREKDFSSLRLAITGAAPVPEELVRRMREELGFETVVTAYGLTETCGVVSICRPEDPPKTIATTSGRPIPDIEVRCVGDDGAEVPRGDVGEIVVRGYNVMKGYFDDDTATTEAIDEDGWLHTGDLATMDDRGYLQITGRIKDMFIMGGFNCYPAEIEATIYRHHDVAAVAVIGVPDDRMGEVGMAFVVPRPGTAITEESVISWCRERMANFKVPRHVRLVSELPLNASGKVRKDALRLEPPGGSR